MLFFKTYRENVLKKNSRAERQGGWAFLGPAVNGLPGACGGYHPTLRLDAPKNMLRDMQPL